MIAEKDFAGRQDCGRRSRQEDSYAFSDISETGDSMESLFVVVADGMGGHTSGEHASQLALENFVDAFHLASGTLLKRFKTSLLAANEAITRELKESPRLDGMGTTLLAAAITPRGVEWISVGDSPLYLWRAGRLTRLNDDHSFRPILDEMIESGQIKASEANRHPLKNILRAALNGREIELIDHSPHPIELEEGDIVLAASDGIQTIDEDEIATVIKKYARSDASTIATILLDAVLGEGYAKQDNVTAAVIKYGEDRFAMHARATEKPASKKGARKRAV